LPFSSANEISSSYQEYQSSGKLPSEDKIPAAILEVTSICVMAKAESVGLAGHQEDADSVTREPAVND